MLAKAAELSADEVFIDLEDSVTPSLKTDATRRQVVAALRGDWRCGTRVVRVNRVGTPWCLDDMLAVCLEAGDVLDCVMVPKVEDASEIHFVSHVLLHAEQRRSLERPIGIEVQIETPRGLMNVESIAAASHRVETLIFGPGDYAASAGMPQLTVGQEEETDVWNYALSRIVAAARAFGLQAIDGPFAAIHDEIGFRKAAERSRALGFDGKWALHPAQLRLCNDVYSPSSAELARAREIVDAYRRSVDENAGSALFGGEMIDEATHKMAQAVIARALTAGTQEPKL